MALRDKTNQRFKEFFEKQSKKNEGKEFEIAYSEIQRETRAANSTMKRAIEALVQEGWLEVKPGRNTRFGLFKLLQVEPSGDDVVSPPSEPVLASNQESIPDSSSAFESDYDNKSTLHTGEKEFLSKIHELEHLIDGLRRRIRTQEMTIALLQDRMAEIEDKLYRR